MLKVHINFENIDESIASLDYIDWCARHNVPVAISEEQNAV